MATLAGPVKVGELDSTFGLWRDGYRFIGNRCDRLGSDIFSCRILLQRAICMRGRAASEFFYGNPGTIRVGAMPVSVVKLLQDFGSVQLLEGSAHAHRKRMFLSIMEPGSVAGLVATVAESWREEIARSDGGEVVLFDCLRRVLTRSACRWAGIPLASEEEEQRVRELSEIIESTGAIGPRMWRALLLRRRAERWAKDIVQGIRSGRLRVASDAPAAVVASYREPGDGTLLPPEVAAVELLNLVRPIVAVARFMVFAAMALHCQARLRNSLAAGSPQDLVAFAEEVRRLTPFFPFVGGKTVRDAVLHDAHVPADSWVILDIYGTNRDPSIWETPNRFDPGRFAGRVADAYENIPQGGGDAAAGHRCPGEAPTLALIALAGHMLSRELAFEVPEQDLSVDLSRIPALPASGFMMRQVRLIPIEPVAQAGPAADLPAGAPAGAAAN